MKSLKDTTTGEGIFECIDNIFYIYGNTMAETGEYHQKWFSILATKKFDIMKKRNNPVKEIYLNKPFILLHCIMDRVDICKCVLDMKYVPYPFVKFVNFIKEKRYNP
ncbi:hypothetical protein RF11_10585 [Thelohanellus kitauei]|uniref:Uncharacterized protein n=1 Tax=Thelohanellus kitauei TaxID=669202 RepID=A0A0C2J9K0_THEKT|nr:hypothetical protein RF11_10585 [Thelohanellus kitauei]